MQNFFAHHGRLVAALAVCCSILALAASIRYRYAFTSTAPSEALAVACTPQQDNDDVYFVSCGGVF